MQNQFYRTELLLGAEALKKLASSRVAVFGVGGVGGYAVEALARAGVGALDLVDNDKVSLTNVNRQIIALHSTLEKFKVDVAAERIADINPNCTVKTFKIFYLPDTEFDFSVYDYVVDAIDTVTAKIALIKNCKAAGVPIISSMGTGNKLDPAALQVDDIYNTKVCPLAKVMRHELRKLGIDCLKVVYSQEEPRRPVRRADEQPQTLRKDVPGSISFVPPVAGLIMAGEVIKDIIGK